MESLDSSKWLDDILTDAICSEKSGPDFKEWRQNHPEAVEMLASGGGQESCYSHSIL